MIVRRALEWLHKKLREFLGAAVFFAVAFSLIVMANRLLIKGSDIEAGSFIRAFVGGLIVAKVLVTVDLLPFVDAFPGKPLVYNIIWKTPIYVVASLLFQYVEPFFTSLFAGASVTLAHHDALHAFAQPRFWAVQIWLTLLLVIFVSMHELSRALGKDKMRLLFFGR